MILSITESGLSELTRLGDLPLEELTYDQRTLGGLLEGLEQVGPIPVETIFDQMIDFSTGKKIPEEILKKVLRQAFERGFIVEYNKD